MGDCLVNKLKIFLRYILIGVISFCFNNVSDVFAVPWIMFCFFYGLLDGGVAFLVGVLVNGLERNWFSLVGYLFLIIFFFFNKLIRDKEYKLEKILSFECFSVVFFIEFFSNEIEKFYIGFLLGVISFWVMRYFYQFYVIRSKGEKVSFINKMSSFVLFMVGVFLLGLGVNEVSFALVVALVFVSSRVGLEEGILESFLLLLVVYFLGQFNRVMLLVLGIPLSVFLLRKTSKITLVITYLSFVFLFLYYFKIDFVYGIQYVVGSFLYLCFPSKLIDRWCFSEDSYLENLVKDNKRRNLEISKKILKMEEVLSLVCEKINGRVRKDDKELFLKEIMVYDSLMKSFAERVKSDKEGMNYYSDIETQIRKYGFDLLSLSIDNNLFNELSVKVVLRCERKDIDNLLVKIISKCLKKSLVVKKIKENKVFDMYEVELKESKKISFLLGVEQRAKDRLVSGDSYLVYENEFKYYLAISDGMGVGALAKESSKATLDLFKKFMEIGFDEKQAINSINYLMKKEGNKDSYATFDLLVYDKYMGEFYFCKNGACNSYVFNDNGVMVVDGNDLPVGIVDKIEVSFNKVDLNVGDYIIMASDGVSEEKIRSFKKLKGNNVQKMAKEVLGRNEELLDDETIIVLKIKDKI